MSAQAAKGPPGECPDCGGPSRVWKGTHHKFRCGELVEAAIGLFTPPPPPRLAAVWPNSVSKKGVSA